MYIYTFVTLTMRIYTIIVNVYTIILLISQCRTFFFSLFRMQNELSLRLLSSSLFFSNTHRHKYTHTNTSTWSNQHGDKQTYPHGQPNREKEAGVGIGHLWVSANGGD